MPDLERDASNHRWGAWIARGRDRDARTVRRMRVLATLVGLALAAWVGWALLGGA